MVPNRAKRHIEFQWEIWLLQIIVLTYFKYRIQKDKNLRFLTVSNLLKGTALKYLRNHEEAKCIPNFKENCCYFINIVFVFFVIVTILFHFKKN